MEEEPITQEQLNRMLYLFLKSRRPRHIESADLYDSDYWLSPDNGLHVQLDLIPKLFTFWDPEARDIPRAWSSNGQPDTEGLKVMQQNSRQLGELLLDTAALDFDAGAESTVPFRTRGYQYLLVVVTNPTWATNPATLTLTVEFSTDGFDTVVAELRGMDNVAIAQVLDVADDTVYCFFLQTGIQAGAQAATNCPSCCPFPDTGLTTIRFTVTPTGAGITAEDITICVWGVNPR